jgi:hypothetical protein
MRVAMLSVFAVSLLLVSSSAMFGSAVLSASEMGAIRGGCPNGKCCGDCASWGTHTCYWCIDNAICPGTSDCIQVNSNHWKKREDLKFRVVEYEDSRETWTNNKHFNCKIDIYVYNGQSGCDPANFDHYDSNLYDSCN